MWNGLDFWYYSILLVFGLSDLTLLGCPQGVQCWHPPNDHSRVKKHPVLYCRYTQPSDTPKNILIKTFTTYFSRNKEVNCFQKKICSKCKTVKCSINCQFYRKGRGSSGGCQHTSKRNIFPQNKWIWKEIAANVGEWMPIYWFQPRKNGKSRLKIAPFFPAK